MSKIHITELVLRDGHQSMIATRLRTEDMLPICSKLDAIGFWSIEAWGGATFDACVRFLKEDPWERLAKLRKALPNSQINMLLRGQNLLGYRHYSDDVVHAFVQKSADNGVDVFRIFDALNDVRNLREAIKAVKKVNKHAIGTLSYTTSPVHDIAYFVAMAKELEEIGADSIGVKDMAGLLTPTVAAQLVKELKAAVNLPVHMHSHATSGLASMVMLKSVESGVDIIDTCNSSFSEGASHPTTESMVAAFKGTPYDTGLDLAKLQEVTAYLRDVRQKYWQYESAFTGVDTRVLVNQVPGGMISNLSNQLKEQGALDKMDAVLAEIPRVREDLGCPNIMLGYLKRPEETAKALVEGGWYRTGDVAYADDHGYLYIVDRAKDMIISGAENIYTTEVENALYAYPGVLEAAVVGVPHEQWGEAVHAEVVPKPGVTLDSAELIAHCRTLIAGYKVPRTIAIRVDPLPKSGAGKILKKDLRAPFWEGRERGVN